MIRGSSGPAAGLAQRVAAAGASLLLAAMTILSEMAERLRETNAMLSQRAAKDVVKEFEENLTWSQRLADKVAELNGSWAFILALMALTAGWCIINIPAIAEHIGLYSKGDDGKPAGFDPYPYILYNLVLAILVSLQGPLIVMSQNRQSAKDRATAETDFRVNLKNEVGIEKMLAELDAKRQTLTSTLLRIEGAMQVLRELLPDAGEHDEPATPPIPASQRASDASLLRRLAEASQRNRQLAEENSRLRRQLARALGDQRASPRPARQADDDHPAGRSPVTIQPP